MGLLSFKKKKKAAAPVLNTPLNDETVASTGKGVKKKWSPTIKRFSTTTPATTESVVPALPTPNILNSLSVLARDDVEVVTLESQRTLMDQREAIRKKLFEGSSSENDYADAEDYSYDDEDDEMHRSSTTIKRNVVMKRAATDVSKEILPNGEVTDTVYTMSDRFSLPMESVSGSWDGSLHKISEEPVEYRTSSAPASSMRLAGPISVDVSYTESELASVLTKPCMTPQSHRFGRNSTEPTSLQRSVNNVDTSFTESDTGSGLTGLTRTSSVDTPFPKPVASALISPSNSSRSSIPMDEREIDAVVEYDRNKGKSPLKGMPDDERLEYQKDEMVYLPPSPIVEIGPLLAMKSQQATNPDVNLPRPMSTVADNPIEENTVDDSTPVVERNSYSIGTSRDTFTSQTMSFAETTRTSVSRVPEVARSIFKAALECGSGALGSTLGVAKDNGCGDVDDIAGATSTENQGKHGANESTSLTSLQPEHKRPVYLDEASTLRFLRRITNNGFVLLYLEPTSESISDTTPSDDWKGRTVTILISKGKAANDDEGLMEAKNSQPPRLEWTTITGGRATDSKTTSINLFDIQSILTDDEAVEDEDDMCFFTITNVNGDVHIFETATVEERDRIVNGLKTLIARWSFQLIAGEVTATSELFDSHNYLDLNTSGGDLPSLPNPSQTMNRVASMLLNAAV